MTTDHGSVRTLSIVAAAGLSAALLAACSQLAGDGHPDRVLVAADTYAEARTRADRQCANRGKEAVYRGARYAGAGTGPPPWSDHYTAVYDGVTSGTDRPRFAFTCE
ncbi:MAG: hypothetical protein R3316_03645 [Rhodovibrionaceae bacterium]|nr:hypothetical protein [Rhodovibrionaceae bacterium]